MNISPINFCGSNPWYKTGNEPLLKDRYAGYYSTLSDNEYVTDKRTGKQELVCDVRTKEIQRPVLPYEYSRYSKFRGFLPDDAIIEYDKNGYPVTIGDVKEEFRKAEEEEMHRRSEMKLDYIL